MTTVMMMKSAMAVVPPLQVKRGGDAHPPQRVLQIHRQALEEVQVLRLLILPILPYRLHPFLSLLHNTKVNPNSSLHRYLLEALRRLQTNNTNRSLLVRSTRVGRMGIIRPITMVDKTMQGCTAVI